MNLFGSTRVPETGKDRIVSDYKSKHVVVQRRGHFYSFDVLDNEGMNIFSSKIIFLSLNLNIISGNIIEPSKLLSRLNYIINDTRPQSEHPIGILTSQDRDVWASQRHHLLQVGNERVMKLIDTAIFNLIFDDESMNDENVKLVKNFLHGDGKNRCLHI